MSIDLTRQIEDLYTRVRCEAYHEMRYAHSTLAGDAVAVVERCELLEAAIREHRDERGDDRCHADDGRLYTATLPEGDTRPARETAVTIENCMAYIACRQTGRTYVSPQRRIEELEAEVALLRRSSS